MAPNALQVILVRVNGALVAAAPLYVQEKAGLREERNRSVSDLAGP